MTNPGRRLRRYRLRAQVTRRGMAERLSMEMGRLEAIELGQSNPTADELHTFAQFFELSLSEIMEPVADAKQ